LPREHRLTPNAVLAGDLGDALEFLALRPDRAEAAMIKCACKGVGASANIVWSIMAGRTNEEVERLKKVYFEVYSKDLGKLLASELHGDMERLVFTCLQAGEETYDPQYHTKDKAVEDAE
jgi:Annexin